MRETTTRKNNLSMKKGSQPSGGWWLSLYRRFSRAITIRLRYYGLDVILNVLCVTCAFELATTLRFIDTPNFGQELWGLFAPNVFIGCLYALIAYAQGLHRHLWAYAGLRDGLALLQSICMMALVAIILDTVNLYGEHVVPVSVIIGGALLSFLVLGGVKMLPRVLHVSLAAWSKESPTRVLIVGAGQAGAALASRFLRNVASGYRVMAFVDDDPAKYRRRLHGRPIVGTADDISEVVKVLGIDLIAIALPTVKAERMSAILSLCQQTCARIKIMQGLNEMPGRPDRMLREVNIADLLGREVIPLHTPEARKVLSGKVILVTGATGSIGSELCQQVLDYQPAVLLALDTNETGLFELAADLHAHPNSAALKICIGDITETCRMEQLIRTEQPQVVFHAAAYKHVPLLERHVDQAVRINVLGTWSLARLAQRYHVERFIFISSDKAAAPVSILGASKRAGELVVQTLANVQGCRTQYCAVRFGNVIGSRGSVVPVFMKQIEQGGPVTVTDAEATRYFMTIPEACGLVIHTATIAENSALFLLDMGAPVRIAEVAEKMIRLQGLRVHDDIPIVYTGLRPGERLHEILAADDEQLLPTTNDKIFRLAHKGGVAQLKAVEQQMIVLQDALYAGDMLKLREHLFMTVQEPVKV